MKEGLVSIIVPTFNAKKFLTSAVQSVLDQTYPNIEVLVVDDGSTDGTENLSVLRDSRVRYIQITHTGGPATPRNVGLKESNGQLIAFLDADDIWLPQKLKRQIKFMEEGSFDFVCCDAKSISENGQTVQESYLGHLGDFDRLKSLNSNAFPRLYEGNFVISSSTLVRKSIFNRAGFFGQGPKLVGVEDYDLWLRAAANGAKFGFLSEKLLLYRERSGSLSDRVQSLNYEREFQVMVKNFGLARKFLGARSKLRPFGLSRAAAIASKGSDLGKYLKYKLLCFWYFPWGTADAGTLWAEAKSVIKL